MKIWSIISGGALFFVGALALYVVVYLLFIKVLWAWTIPDLFPGAVTEGLISGDLSWYASFKIALFVALISSLAGIRGKY